jgi:hypothetical protein
MTVLNQEEDIVRRLTLLIVLAIALLTTASAFGQTLGAVLTGSQETPPNTNPGFGNATVTFDSTRTNITVTITVANLGSPINNFHIHEQVAGASGGVVVNLILLGGVFNNGTMTGTFPIAADVAQRMLQNPNGFYVNVHTNQFPGGAIRGQLAFVSGGPVTYAAELRGSNEVPPNSSAAFGSSLVTLDLFNNNITWEATTSGIVSPTVSHIHRGAAGTSGQVIINFATSPAQLAGGRTFGSNSIAAQQSGAFLPSDLVALGSASTAAGYYVNVHSSAFGAGEIRGQLAPANEYDIAVIGHINGSGTTFVTDVRVFNPSYTSNAAALLEFFPATGSSPNASATMTLNIAPRATAVLDDIAGPSGFNVVGTLGALRVSSATQLVATSRIFADNRSFGKGTFGEFTPAQPRANALRRGVMTQLANNPVGEAIALTGFRTQLGFFNPNPSTVTLRLELRDKDGNLLGQPTINLGPTSQQQNAIGNYFPGVDLSMAANLTVSFDASAPVFAYAGVNDNQSTAPYFVAAQPDSGTLTNQ